MVHDGVDSTLMSCVVSSSSTCESEGPKHPTDYEIFKYSNMYVHRVRGIDRKNSVLPD